MKKRVGFVTNSSSSSFIITNKTDEILTSEEVVLKLMKRILEDAKDRFTLEPGESIEYECGDDCFSDGEFEYFIHNQVDGSSTSNFNFEDIGVELYESHH